MAEKITVPTLGESVTEATVSKWLKSQGEKVTADEPIVELETDKVNVEVPAPINGVLSSITVKEGETVNVGSLLGTINGGTTKAQTETQEIKKYDPPKQDTQLQSKSLKKIIKEEKKTKPLKKTNNKPNLFESTSQNDEEPLILDQIHDDKVKQKPISKRDEKNISPSARKMAIESKIDLSKITGSGKNGIILKEDVMNLMGSKPPPSERKMKHGPEERIKMTRLRQTIAKRLKEAQENAAMLTTFNEVDMSNIISMRKDNQEDFQNSYGIKLGFMSFFVKACIVGLKLFPAINAEVENDEMVYKNYYNVSFAVGTEKGLVVPVLKNADEMSFADIEKNIKDLSDKAKNGSLTIEDLQGGTFTISNGGVYGSMLSTPILNPPQSAVLGMHNIVERPVVVDGEIKARPVMFLALSYDHRIIDGKESVSFLKTVKENLEDPRRLFLNL